MLVLGVLAVSAMAPASATASMQLVAVDEPTPSKTFHVLHGLNPSPERDRVVVSESGTNFTVEDEVGISAFPADCQGVTATSVTCPIGDYDDLGLFTGPGRDLVTSNLSFQNLTRRQIFSSNIAVYMNANLGPGADVYRGGPGTDGAFGGAGPDRLVGNGGNDVLDGGAGNDGLAGADGIDTLFGGKGHDRLNAGPGVPDIMIGGRGPDLCIAHEGHDRVGGCERVRL